MSRVSMNDIKNLVPRLISLKNSLGLMKDFFDELDYILTRIDLSDYEKIKLIDNKYNLLKLELSKYDE